MKTILFTVLALLAFAGNSVLCRLALKGDVIDAASFTAIRLFSGIVFLMLLVVIQTKGKVNLKKGSWLSAFLLFLYGITFSYAYISLDTGTGALILFGVVQVTMILTGLLQGKSLIPIEWIGLCLAFSGLVLFLVPGAAAPSLSGFGLMTLSGIAWAFYTLAGRGSQNPLLDTTNNFLRTLPFILLLIFFTVDKAQLSSQGVLLAILSGSVTSGLGYAIWYSALSGLTITKAAIIQLSVPIIAAIGGVIFVSEEITTMLIVSSLLVLGGILVVILGKNIGKRIGKNID
ncbi:DMT family transporter [Cocleimonas sp. KMM 6892]|uniref:DMT family transporter n=1 Tax=unclassified Cocleimonas TaxID=2639732 RepID=UPI002DB9A98F|nr:MULTISPECIES: DMT family transporter [unclassified Cocleimonas]MEB8433448.1 DMT family transporter [Cocleimonas sp. KMM 6892]MEC4716259.1 DMT family transporter [Cocleimonas sp. KMM 6895]